jgi:hypothetical protein
MQRPTCYYLNICPPSHPISSIRDAKALKWQAVTIGQKQQKPTPSCPAEKVGLQCLMLSPPVLAIGCDGGNDGYVSVNIYALLYYTTTPVSNANRVATVGQKQGRPAIRTALTIGRPRTFGDRRLSEIESRDSNRLRVRLSFEIEDVECYGEATHYNEGHPADCWEIPEEQGQ